MPSQTASPSSATRAKRKRCNHPDGCRRLAPPGRKRCDDHKPGASARPPGRSPGRKKIYGRAEPRLFTRPLRPLTRKTSRGYEVIDFARMIGEPLLPWQEFAAIHALELNPDGTYRFRTVLVLVARQNGKSHLKRIITLWRMYLDDAKRILGVAQDLALARDQWQLCQETIHASPDLEEGEEGRGGWQGVRKVNGSEMFWAAGCRYAIKAANGKAGRGGSNDEVNIDELREQRDWKAWAAVSKTTQARDKGQVWAMSNAGDATSVVLNQLRDTAIAETDPSLCLMEWSGEDGCELDDWDQIRQANPGLGYTVSAAAIRSSLGTDPPEIYRTEVLCQKVDNLDAAIDAARWDACADAAGTLDKLRDRAGACFDCSPDGRHATLAVAAKAADGRVRVEIAEAWDDVNTALAALPAYLARIKPGAFGWYSAGPAAGGATILRGLAAKYNHHPGGKRGPQEIPEDGAITGARVTEACQELAVLVKGSRVIHPADPLLDAHAKAASKLKSGDGWRFTRIGQGHVDGAYAAAGAVRIALTMPAQKKPGIRMING